MQFLVMKVVQTADGSAYSEGYASCWIDVDSELDALIRAQTLIGEKGWIMEELLEAYEVSWASYGQDSDGLQYFEQATIDGEVVVIFVAKSTG